MNSEQFIKINMIQNCYIGSEEKEQHCIFITNPCDILLVLEVYFSDKKIHSCYDEGNMLC